MSKLKAEDALIYMTSWEICRICAGNNCDVVAIYDENGINLQLAEKINQYLPITVSQEDKLPLHMCKPCIEKLNITHELILACLAGDGYLKELLQLKKKYLELDICEDSYVPGSSVSEIVYEKEGIVKEDSFQQYCEASSVVPLSELEACEALELDVMKEGIDAATCNETDLEDNEEIDKTTNIAEYLAQKENTEEEYNTSEEVKRDILMGDEEEGIQTELPMNSDSGAENDCEFCNESFEDLESHMQNSMCEYCGIYLTCAGALQIHEELDHHKQYFSCTVLSSHKKFCDKNKSEEHIAQRRMNEPYLCDVCGRSYTTATNLQSHYRSHREPPEERTCYICKKQLRSRFNLRKHMMSHTGDKPFLCEQCSKRFSSKDALKQHLAVHSREKAFKCTMCSFSTVRRGNLAKHYETHADAKFDCQICHKSFATRYDLQNHHYTHTDEELSKIKEVEGPGMLVYRSFRCEQCGKFLSSKASLIIHQRIHSGDRPFQCKECGKRFRQKASLAYHVRLHTGERPHQCGTCGQHFNSKAAKECHERVHTGEKPYNCNKCSATFRNRANLRQHQLIHNDSREFPCNVCGKRFRRREAVQVHMRVHTGERPFSCPLCLKKFTQKGDQLKHTRAHETKKDNRCSFCGREFSNRRALKQHKCKSKVIDDSQHSDTVLLNPTPVIANKETTVVTADISQID